MLPYVMATILAREERLGDILDIEVLLALATSDTNLHLITTLVDAELALVGHVDVGCR